MSQRTIAVDRKTMGWMALASLGVTVVAWLAASLLPPMAWGACLRMTLVLAAFWVAMPSRDDDPAWAYLSPWALGGILLAVFAAVLRPKVALPAILIAVVVTWLVKPRRRRR